MIYNQSEFDLRCEWGPQGVAQLAPISDVIVIVDVLSFSTCVEIATNNGAIIFPYAMRDESVIDYAKSVQAELASHRQRWTTTGYSLSPKSVAQIPAGTRLVLPSPNGSFLTLHTGNTPTLAGCLRNCQAVAQFAQKYGDKIAVIPAGERWKEDDSLRGCLKSFWTVYFVILSVTKWSEESQFSVMVGDATLGCCSVGHDIFDFSDIL
ncbi:2-phosphosulfolactate phosphatase [Nostoc sp.]|uniref:2-phosphosulfolactate phosphatase n=1 Tax=Nostoc sp. TaxID=1180 RepID=UPI002FF69992